MNQTSFYESLAVWSQVVGAVAFVVVLVYVFQRFLTPAVRASQERKNQELLDAEKRRDAARAEVEVARSEAGVADSDVASIRERGEHDAQRERERILAEAKAEGERLVRNAQGELERGRGQAREALRDELLAKALEIARASAARLDDATNGAIVRDVMQTVETGGGA